MELPIDDRRQLVEGELVSVAPGTEELADIVERHRCSLPGPLDDCWEWTAVRGSVCAQFVVTMPTAWQRPSTGDSAVGSSATPIRQV